MSDARKRKEASKRLGLEFAKRYENLVTASGDDEIAMRAVELGQVFNDNIEFVIWVLKTYGGLDNPKTNPLPEPQQRPAPLANGHGLPKLPQMLTGQD